MPPHCDSLDGPVVTAARMALVDGDVDLVLPYVPAATESEVVEAFALAAKARIMGGEAEMVAERWFFETVVRLHRLGEGAPFTGLKPAGLDVGPVIPVAERALAGGSAEELADLLCTAVREQVQARHTRVMALAEHARDDVAHARAHVEAALGLQVWAHHLHQTILAHADAEAAAHDHG
jgi:hypothetical protein